MSRIVRCALAALCLVAGACAEDRPRPSPLAPPDLELTATVTSPPHSTFVYAGRAVQVIVAAGVEDGRYLAGIGFVARTVPGNVLIDSVRRVFPQFRVAASDTFLLAIPQQLANNTQLDIRGLAFGPAGQFHRSTPVSVIAVQCPAGTPGCPP